MFIRLLIISINIAPRFNYYSKKYGMGALNHLSKRMIRLAHRLNGPYRTKTGTATATKRKYLTTLLWLLAI